MIQDNYLLLVLYQSVTREWYDIPSTLILEAPAQKMWVDRWFDYIRKVKRLSNSSHGILEVQECYLPMAIVFYMYHVVYNTGLHISLIC